MWKLYQDGQSYTPTEENETIQFTININLGCSGYSVFCTNQISISKLAVIQYVSELLFEFRERTNFVTNVQRFNLQFCDTTNLEKLKDWNMVYFGGYKLSGNKLQVWSMILWNPPGDPTHLVAWVTSALTFTSRHFTSCSVYLHP